LVLLAGCRDKVRGQPLPQRRLAARSADFSVPDGVTALHYYGSGGWGIRWRGEYVLLAPYFSNHEVSNLLSGAELIPNRERIARGFAGTPVGQTTLILVGHGHIDHAGDVPGYFEDGLVPPRQAGLIADTTVVNILGTSWDRFRCVNAVEPPQYGKPVQADCLPRAIRVTPLHSAHAPHLQMLDIDFEAFGGTVTQKRTTPPVKGSDFRLGYPLAFMIDLLDPEGQTAFRIHYMDAAADPPHGLPSAEALADGRDIDVHIACVPGFNFMTDYPQGILRAGNVRYVLAGHWEDFFRDPEGRLQPVRNVLDESKLNVFVEDVESAIEGRRSRGVKPLGECAPDGTCGPRGETWSLPVPGETFQFRTGPQSQQPRVADTPP
jgi:L-ascorbate metabolism protein UlaG (beta-lactamase superfamily)